MASLRLRVFALTSFTRLYLRWSIDQFNSTLMAATFEGRIEPNSNKLQGSFNSHHTLAKGNHVRVIVLAAQAGGFHIPTQSATDTHYTIGHHRFAIARAAKNDPTLELAARDRLRHGTDEQRIIHGLLGMGSEIKDTVPQLGQKEPNLLFIQKPGMV
jgi:hypothetical protein